MIDAKTKLCCIIGNPVEHSVSPEMHNAGYEALKLNFIWLAFRIENVKVALSGFKAFGIRGAAVTIPHKQNVMQYLDEIDETAQKIGAVNTILNKSGTLFGTNTDWIGAMQALEEKTFIKGKNAVVLGAGGAARAIIYGLKQNGAVITILNRTKDTAQKLAEEFNIEKWGGLEDNEGITEADIIMNTTACGMYPNISDCPIATSLLHKDQIVFDAVFNPLETKLIREAKKKNCTVIPGYKMLLNQALLQFELFTGTTAPVSIMEEALLQSL